MEKSRKGDDAMIGYVVGKKPPFKMLKFVYAIWNFVTASRVFLHDEGYYIFRFEDEHGKQRSFKMALTLLILDW